MFLVLMTHPFFFFPAFLWIFASGWESWGPDTEPHWWECLFGGGFPSHKPTHSLTHSHLQEEGWICVYSFSSSCSFSSDNKDGASWRLRRPSGVQPARSQPVFAPKAILPPSGHDPDADLWPQVVCGGRGLLCRPAKIGNQAVPVVSEHQPQTTRAVAAAFLQVPPCRPGGPTAVHPARLHHPGDARPLPAAHPLPAQQRLLLPDLAALHPDRRPLLSDPLHDSSAAGQRQPQPRSSAAPQGAREGRRQPTDARRQHQARATGAGPDVPRWWWVRSFFIIIQSYALLSNPVHGKN